MAGSPQRERIREELSKLAVDNGADDPLDIENEADREAYRKSLPLVAVADHLESGGTLLQLATLLSARVGFAVHRKTLSRAVEKIDGAPEVLAKARESGADSMVDLAIQILDEAPAQREEIAKAAKRAEVRQWVASRAAPARWGDQKNVNLRVGFAAEHLDALRKVRRDELAVPFRTRTARNSGR